MKRESAIWHMIFTAQPRLIQLLNKASGNNLIWYDKVSAAANAPVCAQY